MRLSSVRLSSLNYWLGSSGQAELGQAEFGQAEFGQAELSQAGLLEPIAELLGAS